MIFLNKLLAKIDLALIKRSRISKAEKEVREIKTLRKELQQARKEAHEAGLLSKEAQKASMSLEQRLLSLPLLRPAGFPPHTTQIALILYAKDLDKVTEVMAGQPQCRLEHIALVDAGPNSPPRIPFTDKDGDRAVPVGNLETLKQHPQLELVYYQPNFEATEDSRSLYQYIGAIKKLHEVAVKSGIWVVSPPRSGWPISYQPTCKSNWSQQFDEIYSFLEDTESKRILAQSIRVRTTGNLGYYSLSDYPEYFHPKVTVHPGDIVFDAGIFKGNYPTPFLAKQVTDKGHVYGFEPSPQNYAEAAKELHSFKNVTLLPVGLWREEGSLGFKQSGGDSKVMPGAQGENIIQASLNSIDAIMEQKKISKLNFIKMDIEGAELAALEGSVDTLRKHKPNLAICLYHKPMDLIEIPLFISRLGLGYKIYMGHHSPLLLDTVLYATTR